MQNSYNQRCPRPIPIFVAQRRMARLQRPTRQRSSVSDSNLCCSKEERPACSGRSGDALPRPTLIFLASKKNGPPAADVAATSSASDSILRCCEEEWPASRTGLLLHRFLISGGEFGNRYRECPGLALLCAAIPDFRGSIWELLQGFPRLSPFACSDS